MPITRSTKELSTTAISCGDSFDVILTLAAEPDITSNPPCSLVRLVTQSLPYF